MRQLILSSLLLGAALSACTWTEDPPLSTGPIWEEPAAYSYSVSSSCGERTFIGSFTIEVAQGTVVGAEALDQSAEAVIASSDLEALPTVGNLVAEYTSSKFSSIGIEGEADVAIIEFSPEDHHPISITIDYDTDAMDDEACYTVTSFSERP